MYSFNRKYQKMLQVFVFLLVFFVSYESARAANLEWENDTHISMGGNTYTIAAGSEATSMVVGATTITITVPANSEFILSTTNKFLLNNNQNISTECSADNSKLTVFGSTTPGTVVVTPDTTSICSFIGGSGNSGSGFQPTTPSDPSTAVHPDGTLIIHNGTIYLIQNGMRVGFRNAAEYQSHGYNFNQAVVASEGDMALPLSTSVIKALQGTLVLDASDNKTVYMIGANGTKRGFASAEVFASLGYNFNNLPSINVSDYPAGDPITDANMPHPEGALVLNNGTVWWIMNNTRVGFESEAVFKTYGFSWSKIVQANTADMNLSEGPLVKLRDGTLVMDSGSYYLISGGKKLMFTSTQDMSARGYQINNAITASLSGYVLGGNVE